MTEPQFYFLATLLLAILMLREQRPAWIFIYSLCAVFSLTLWAGSVGGV